MQPKNSEDVHGGEDGILFSRIRAVYKAQKDHLVVLNKFKRFPPLLSFINFLSFFIIIIL